MQRELQITIREMDGPMDRDEFGAVLKHPFDLHVVHQFRDPGKDLIEAKQSAAKFHQIGNGVRAVADHLQCDSRYQCDGLRMIKAQAAANRLWASRPPFDSVSFSSSCGARNM
jgi:hypothetical protein